MIHARPAVVTAALLALAGLTTTAHATDDGNTTKKCTISNVGSDDNNSCGQMIIGNNNTTGTAHTIGAEPPLPLCLADPSNPNCFFGPLVSVPPGGTTTETKVECPLHETPDPSRSGARADPLATSTQPGVRITNTFVDTDDNKWTVDFQNGGPTPGVGQAYAYCIPST
ncbi:hypothetical protein ABT187_46355 [Streptomyces sp. NPDC001817]|uniref:hypothetical protein n=1 Tax=Streptomyces sp. NPDC001817 TaxID=3154398 RepID=UPI0033230E43